MKQCKECLGPSAGAYCTRCAPYVNQVTMFTFISTSLFVKVLNITTLTKVQNT